MSPTQQLHNGWLVQLVTTGNLLATIRIYPFRELTTGPLPILYDCQEMWPAVNERVEVNLVHRLRQLNADGQAQLKRYISSPPVSGASYVFTQRDELKTFLLATLQLFGETPATARRRTAGWLSAADHRRMPPPKEAP